MIINDDDFFYGIAIPSFARPTPSHHQDHKARYAAQYEQELDFQQPETGQST
jgi:hypothetical protein